MRSGSDLMAINEQISWTLSRPAMSPWLKNALKSALDRNPIDVLNDLEILDHLLRAQSDARIRSTLGKYASEL